MTQTHRRRAARVAASFILGTVLAGPLADSARAEVGDGTKIVPAQAGAYDRVGRSVALSGDGGTLILGAPAGFIGSDGRGTAYVYVRGAEGWLQEARLIPGDSSPTDQFGQSVALSADGDTAIIGSWDAGGGPGSAYVFQRLGGSWLEQSKLAPADGPLRYFGWSVDVTGGGGTLALGSPTFELGGTGSVYLFTGGADGWSEAAKLSPLDTLDATGFGSTVALCAAGDVLAAGNSSHDSVHLFVDDGAGWAEVQQLTGTDLGSAVDLSADGAVLVAGANSVWTGSGYADVYGRTGGSWELEATLTAGEPENADWFGSAATISAAGDVIAVGANFSDVAPEVDVGSAYLYARVGGSWSDGEKVSPGDPTYNDEFGNALSLSDDGATLLVGAHNKDFIQPPPYRGAAYVYEILPGVGGSATGLAPVLVECTNRTTRQTVRFAASGTAWDCEAHGLTVSPGDRVLMIVGGTVE